MTKQTIVDYGDFKITINQTTSASKETLKRVNEVETRHRRKRKMVEKGILSKQAGKSIEAAYRKDLIGVYVDCIIVGWEGKFKNEPLPEYNRENALKFFEGKDKELLLVDLTEVSLAEILQGKDEVEEEVEEAEEQLQKEEVKN